MVPKSEPSGDKIPVVKVNYRNLLSDEWID
jgi:hypothetical protein